MYKKQFRLPPKDRRKRKMPKRLEILRCSPYMFYHGGDEEEEEEQTRIGKKSHLNNSEEDGNSPTKRSLKTEANKAVEERDQEFTSGEVDRVLARIVKRSELLANHPYRGTFSEEVADNMEYIRRHLSRSVKLDSDSPTPQIPHGAFRTLLQDTFEVQSTYLPELLIRQFDPKGTGNLPYTSVLNAINEALNGDKATAVAEACFAVFDLPNKWTIRLTQMRTLRAAKIPVLKKGMDAGTSRMVKAMLDGWHEHVGTTSTTWAREDFVDAFLGDEKMIVGMIEEVLRQVLVLQFGMRRDDIVDEPAPTPASTTTAEAKEIVTDLLKPPTSARSARKGGDSVSLENTLSSLPPIDGGKKSGMATPLLKPATPATTTARSDAAPPSTSSFGAFLPSIATEQK